MSSIVISNTFPLVLYFVYSSTELCSRVAFGPLSKTLTCNTGCTAENVSVVWKFSKTTPVTNATFRYGVPHKVDGAFITFDTVEVLANGQLSIETFNTQAHKGDYTCTAYFSNDTICGNKDEFFLEGFQLCKLSFIVI